MVFQVKEDFFAASLQAPYDFRAAAGKQLFAHLEPLGRRPNPIHHSQRRILRIYIQRRD